MSDDRRELADRLARWSDVSELFEDSDEDRATLALAAVALRESADLADENWSLRCECDNTAAERDAAVARADAAEASARILAQGELDMTVRALLADQPEGET